MKSSTIHENKINEQHKFELAPTLRIISKIFDIKNFMTGGHNIQSQAQGNQKYKDFVFYITFI